MKRYMCFCINLKRRPDRKKHMEKLFIEHNIECEFVDAVDGKELRRSDPRLKLFAGNNFNNRVGVIGCALSHIELYNKLISDDKHDYYVIFEDDIIMIPNFNDMLQKVFDRITKHMDIVYFGYNSNDLAEHPIYSFNIKKLKKIAWGTYGYIISKKAAKYIINNINKNGIDTAIDHYLCISGMQIYLIEPCLVQITDVQNKHIADSDIQQDLDKIDIDNIDNNGQINSIRTYIIIIIILTIIIMALLIYYKYWL